MTHRYVLMGVSGCGKTTVGEALAAQLGLRFIDGDALHPATNVKKMSDGIPLDDHDRAPWLACVGQELARPDGPVIIGCSALKRDYRDIIRSQTSAPVHFIHLDAPKDVLAARVADRPGHFMPASLLESQFEALVPVGPDELGRKIDITMPVEEVVAQCAAYIEETNTDAGT